ncbi:hypothetical protein BDZ45DRAFT_547405, partial [Acephala macrosclerotiorum]
QHYSTPHKTAVRTVVWWENRKKPLDRTPKTEIFEAFNVTRKRGYEILSDENDQPSSRTYHNQPTMPETRGRKPKISKEQADMMEDIIENCGWEGRTMSWEQLGAEAGVDCETVAIRRVMQGRGYHMCKACRKFYISDDLAPRREKWAADMEAKYPKKEDWYRVRFSDECHGSFGPQGKVNVIRTSKQRGHPDCIQEVNYKKREEDSYKVHWWAAVGHDFKSPIQFYDVDTNSNGKMTHRVYIDQILEPVVKPWLDAGHDFVLEEDGDSGHGYNKNGTPNVVTKWKKDHGLETYRNCVHSPDLSPVENCWQPIKHHIREQPHWDVDTLKELVLEAWDRLSQKSINNWVDEMPDRLKAV